MKKNNSKHINKRNKKKTILFAGIGTLTILGGTLAYFTTSDNFDNLFTTAKYEAKLVEQFTSPESWTPGTVTPKTVKVTNNGNIAMAVRASFTESWKDANNNNLALKDANNNVAAIIGFGSSWEKADDGYYYYGSKSNLTRLEPAATSTSFINNVAFNKDIQASLTKSTSADGKTITYSSNGTGYDNAKYTLTINIETVQYDQASNIWGSAGQTGNGSGN